jgi:hypothetical protein
MHISEKAHLETSDTETYQESKYMSDNAREFLESYFYEYI